jgi:hypothetical protein
MNYKNSMKTKPKVLQPQEPVDQQAQMFVASWLWNPTPLKDHAMGAVLGVDENEKVNKN